MKFQLSQEEQARCGCSPHLKRIADGESNQPGRDIEAQFPLEVALDGRKQGSKEDDKVAHKLQTNGQPPGEGEREGGREREREGEGEGEGGREGGRAREGLPVPINCKR